MRIIDKTHAREAADALRNGGVVALPTDTVFGLVADAANEEAVSRIFAMKERDPGKPLGIFAKDANAASRAAQIPEDAFSALDEGATIVAPRIRVFAPGVGTETTIAVRVPRDAFLQELLSILDSPLAQTSANLSGKDPVQSAEEAYEAFGKEALAIGVAGEPQRGVPSAVIDYTVRPPRVLRRSA